MAEVQSRAIADEDAARDQVIELGRRGAGDDSEEVRVDPVAHQCGGRHRAPGRAVQSHQSRQYGVPDRRRQVVGRGLHHLGDEEGVATCHPVELPSRDVGPIRELLDRGLGEKGHVNAPGRALGGQLAQDDPQRMVRGQRIVAVGDGEQGSRPGDAAAEEAEQVQGRLVGPVDVLHDDHGQPLRGVQLAEQVGEQLVPRDAGTAGVEQRTAELVGDVEERPQRPWREQPVTRPGGPPGRGTVAPEALEQRGLADTCLAPHEDEPAVPLRRVLRILRQSGEEMIPLQQPHLWIVPPHRWHAPEAARPPASVGMPGAAVSRGGAGWSWGRARSPPRGPPGPGRTPRRPGRRPRPGPRRTAPR